MSGTEYKNNNDSENSDDSSDEERKESNPPPQTPKASSTNRNLDLHVKIDGRKLDVTSSTQESEINTTTSRRTPPLNEAESYANVVSTQSTASTANSTIFSPLAIAIIPTEKMQENPESTITVFVKSAMRPNPMSVKITADSTVLDLKYAIDGASDLPLPPSVQMLSLNSKALSDDDARLSSVGVVDGVTINMCAKMNSGPRNLTLSQSADPAPSAMIIILPKSRPLNGPDVKKPTALPVKLPSSEQLAAEQARVSSSRTKMKEIRDKRAKRSKSAPCIFKPTPLKSKPSKERLHSSHSFRKQKSAERPQVVVEGSVKSVNSDTTTNEMYDRRRNEDECCAMFECNRHLKAAELIRGKCRCAASFCFQHLPANNHHCTYDYKKHGRCELAAGEKKSNK